MQVAIKATSLLALGRPAYAVGSADVGRHWLRNTDLSRPSNTQRHTFGYAPIVNLAARARCLHWEGR